MLRRYLPFVLVTGLSIVFLLSVFQKASWRRLPQSIGLGEAVGPTAEEIASGKNILPDLRTLPWPQKQPPSGSKGFQEPKVDSNTAFAVGRTKPAGSNYTKTLVVPKTAVEDTSWIEETLGDMLESGLLRSAVYAVDDRSAALHSPKNKGHEVMVYLSYIIDHYDMLPDVSIFMHAHRWAWHNNELMGTDAAEMVRYLSPERVTRDGYMNLRCHWDPGCPDWLHPGATVRNVNKQEEWLLAESWAELFPLDPIPTILAQPCCAQFAASKERILSSPKRRYVELRDWVLRTELDDYLSGRVFEYIWQYIFTASPIHCPSMSACYCDGYGLCFGSPEAFDSWFELRYQHREYAEELRLWTEQANAIAVVREHSKDGKIEEEALLEVPEVGRDKWLMAKTDELYRELEARKKKAFDLGRDPRQRALESGREWQEGDGF